VGGKAYGKATGLYNKHCKYSEQWNPWHPFHSAHDFQSAQSFSQHMEMWIDQHWRHGLENIRIESISNNPSCRQKHPGVPVGSDGSDGTSYPLTEKYTLPIARASATTLVSV